MHVFGIIVKWLGLLVSSIYRLSKNTVFDQKWSLILEPLNYRGNQHFWMFHKKPRLYYQRSRGSAPLWLCPSSSFCSSSSKVLPIPSIHKQSRPTPPPIPVFLFKTTPPKKQNKDASTINHQPKQRHRCTVVWHSNINRVAPDTRPTLLTTSYIGCTPNNLQRALHVFTI